LTYFCSSKVIEISCGPQRAKVSFSLILVLALEFAVPSCHLCFVSNLCAGIIQKGPSAPLMKYINCLSPT
jgi:hypothetical protein